MIADQRFPLCLTLLAGLLVLGAPTPGQCHLEEGQEFKSAVEFHQHGMTSLPGVGHGYDPSELQAAVRALFALPQSRASGAGTTTAILGIPVRGGGYRLFVVDRIGKADEISLPTAATLARPSAAGFLAILLEDGRLLLRSPGGPLAEISASATAPVWDEQGTSLCFVERLERTAGDDAILSPVAIRKHDAVGGRTRDVFVGRGLSYPVLSPDGGDVLFVSVAGGIAAFWTARADGGAPLQVTNVAAEMDASFVPVPSGDPIWEGASDRIYYPIDYGTRREIWCLELCRERSRVLTIGRVAVGSEPMLDDQELRYSAPDGTRAALSLRSTPIQNMDFGARSEGGDPGINQTHIDDPGTGFGLWSPVKAVFPRIYQGFRCDNDHPGHDFDAPRWTQIYAAADGNVVSSVVGLGAGSQVEFGNHLVIEHPQMRLQTLYAHLENGSVWTPFPGTFVGAGMPIGRAGDSGAANNIPHLHFGMKFQSLPSVLSGFWQSLFGGTSLGGLPWVDSTPLYAQDLMAGHPSDIGLPRRPINAGFGISGWRACNLLQYPSPSWRCSTSRDVDPPEVSGFRVYRTTASTSPDRVHVECVIADPSGVYDDATFPGPGSPLSRGVFLVLNPPFSDAIVPMTRISGDQFSGTYRTDYDIAVPPRRTGWTWDFNFMVHAQDRALEGIAFANIGNGGTSQNIFIESTAGVPMPTGTWDEVPLRDLGVSFVTSPTYVITGGSTSFTVRVTNHSSWTSTTTTGRVALNPTLDKSTPPDTHAELGTFSILPLAPGASIDLPLTLSVPSGLRFVPQNLIVVCHGRNDPEWRNSSVRRQVQVVPPRPDLEVTAMNGPTTFAPGATSSVSVTVRNSGVQSALSDFTCALWISLDTHLGDANDIPMGWVRLNMSSPLSPGQSRTVSIPTLQLPGNAMPGIQNLFACVDSTSEIAELDETNNCRSAS